jgi:hypothetical protein
MSLAVGRKAWITRKDDDKNYRKVPLCARKKQKRTQENRGEMYRRIECGPKQGILVDGIALLTSMPYVGAKNVKNKTTRCSLNPPIRRKKA